MERSRRFSASIFFLSRIKPMGAFGFEFTEILEFKSCSAGSNTRIPPRDFFRRVWYSPGLAFDPQNHVKKFLEAARLFKGNFFVSKMFACKNYITQSINDPCSKSPVDYFVSFQKGRVSQPVEHILNYKISTNSKPNSRKFKLWIREPFGDNSWEQQRPEISCNWPFLENTTL